MMNDGERDLFETTDDFCPENAYGECEAEYEYTDADGTVRTATATPPVRSLRELGIDPQDPCLVPSDDECPF
jgi:hypothetical protein